MVAFIVLEQDVVFGTVLLDERTLQHQRFKLAAHDDIIEVVDQCDHPPHLGGVVCLRAEILADAVFEFFRFADINDGVGGILHNVHARLLW